jgi:hypothetical protein
MGMVFGMDCDGCGAPISVMQKTPALAMDQAREKGARFLTNRWLCPQCQRPSNPTAPPIVDHSQLPAPDLDAVGG